MKKKLTTVLCSSLLISGLAIPQSVGAEGSNEVTENTETSTAATNYGTNSISSTYDRVITPMYIPVTVNKPIKYQGVLTKTNLKTIIEYYDRRKSQLDAMNAITGLINAAQGVSDSFTAASLISGTSKGGSITNPTGIERMKKAYYLGENYYYVAVYASGVDPSLSIEVMGVYSTTPIRITYEK